MYAEITNRSLELSLRIISWNMGTGEADYLYSLINDHLKENSGAAPWTEEAYNAAYDEIVPTLEKRYGEAEKVAAELLLKDDVRGHIYCLQEGGKFNGRPLIEGLRAKGFQFFHSQESKDTVVAVDPSRFQVLSGNDLPMYDFKTNASIGLVRLKDRITGYEMMAASVWAPGFSFPKLELQKKEPEGVPEGDCGAPYFGDQHCFWVAQLLKQPQFPRMAFVGADMNASYIRPEQDEKNLNSNPGQWNRRYEYFTNEGFSVLQPPIDFATNVNPKPGEPEGTHERCIDTGLVRFPTLPIWKWVVHVAYNLFFEVFSNPQAKLREDINPLDGFDPAKNASDHRPLFFEIHFQRNPSWISRIFFRALAARTTW